jgi:hypothetical protein
MGDPHEDKPPGYENGTIFGISEKVRKDGQPFKQYNRSRLMIIILDDKKDVFYTLNHTKN